MRVWARLRFVSALARPALSCVDSTSTALILELQPVAYARFGDQQLRLGRPSLHLLAQLDAQAMRIGDGVEPDMLQQVAAR